MVALTSRPGLNLPLSQLAVAVTAGLAFIALAIAPSELIERVVMASGLPAIVPAAAPPLGLTARLALLFAAGCGLVALAWLASRMTGGASLRFGATREVDPIDIPAIRRADAHPDAPARAPVRATRDLGSPFDADLARFDIAPAEAETALPADLDTPLAAYDPAAVRPIPLRFDRPPAPLPRPERLESFDPAPRSAPLPTRTAHTRPIEVESANIEPIAAPETEATIHALLARLERGIERKRRGPAPPQIHAALDSLRRAVRA